MPGIPVPEFLNNRGTAPTETFATIFGNELFDWVTASLSEVRHDMDTEIAPENLFLIASMLSASAMKTDACFSSDQVSYIRDGLQMEVSDYIRFFAPEQYEVAAVGALIQVLSAGKRVLELKMIDEGDLRQSLEDIGEIIKCPTGEKVLQVCPIQRDLGPTPTDLI
jgi:hypothetical protein